MNRNDPFTPMTEEQILLQLAIAREHAEQGLVMKADDAISALRSEYKIN